MFLDAKGKTERTYFSLVSHRGDEKCNVQMEIQRDPGETSI